MVEPISNGGAYYPPRLLRFQDNLDAAIALVQRAIQIDLKVHGPEHPDLALHYDALGEIFDRQVCEQLSSFCVLHPRMFIDFLQQIFHTIYIITLFITT